MAASFINSACTTPRQDATSSPLVGTDLSFALDDLEGKQRSENEWRGSVVIVDLWATWCKPCLASFPFYRELYETHQADGLAVVAISVDTDDDEVRAFVDARKLPFTVLRDPEGTLPASIDLQTMPTMILLGRDGRVREVHEGFIPSDKPRLKAAIAAALREDVGAEPGAPR